MAQTTNTTNTTNTANETTNGATEARKALAAAGVDATGIDDVQAVEAAQWLGKGYAHAAEKLRSAVAGTVPARFAKLHSMFTSMAAESEATGEPVTYTLQQVCEATGKRADITPATLRLQYSKMRGYTGDVDGCTVDIDKATGTVTVRATGA